MVRIGNLRTTHFSRNPKIARVLDEYEYVREFCEGIDRIYREMAEVGQPAPEFKQYDYMLRATIRKFVPQDKKMIVAMPILLIFKMVAQILHRILHRKLLKQ